jgi:hypothetical protein
MSKTIQIVQQALKDAIITERHLTFILPELIVSKKNNKDWPN